jgi:arginine/lysine/ornithine decarboxylase
LLDLAVLPLFASLDVDAHMQSGRNGLAPWDDTIRIGIEIRKKLRALKAKFAAMASKDERKSWFFDPFVPDVVTRLTRPRYTRSGNPGSVGPTSVTNLFENRPAEQPAWAPSLAAPVLFALQEGRHGRMDMDPPNGQDGASPQPDND